MPVLSTFYGISIKMYFRQTEHNPPHFHASYAGYNAAIGINDLKVLDGSLPPRALMLVQEWTLANREKLLEIWHSQVFEKIAPLE